MDAEYLKASVGDVLAKGMAETVLMRPDDPVQYLAQFLIKSVSDEAESQLVASRKAEAVMIQGTKQEMGARLLAEKNQKQDAIQVQVDREDKRLNQLLGAAESHEDAFSAVLGYIRTRTSASCYLMATDLPQKAFTPTSKVAGDAATSEYAGGDVSVAPALETLKSLEPKVAAAASDNLKPKHIPLSLKYVAFTSNDKALLEGKFLSRDAPFSSSEDDEEVHNTPPPGAGVAFDAVDSFLKHGTPFFHLPNALEDSRVKFWYIPRMGGLLLVPVPDHDGDVQLVLGLDLLGLERAFTDEEISLVQGLVGRLKDTMHKVDMTLAELNAMSIEQLTSAAEAQKADLAAAVDEATPKLNEEPLAVLIATEASHKKLLADLNPDVHLKYLKTRKECATPVLLVIKAVMWLFMPDARTMLQSLSWNGVRAEVDSGRFPLDDIFACISKLDVVANSDTEGWDGAQAMISPQLKEEPEPAVDPEAVMTTSFITFLLLDWFKAAKALFDAKTEKERARAEVASSLANAEESTLAVEPTPE